MDRNELTALASRITTWIGDCVVAKSQEGRPDLDVMADLLQPYLRARTALRNVERLLHRMES